MVFVLVVEQGQVVGQGLCEGGFVVVVVVDECLVFICCYVQVVYF